MAKDVDFVKVDGSSFGYFAIIAILAFFTAAGLIAHALDRAYHLSDLSNRVPWGIVNAGIPYFIGLSAGSLIVSALSGVFKIERFKAFSRIAAFFAAAYIVAAIMSIVFDIGKLYHFANAVIYFNPTSIFSWNAFFYELFRYLRSLLACSVRGNGKAYEILRLLGSFLGCACSQWNWSNLQLHVSQRAIPFSIDSANVHSLCHNFRPWLAYCNAILHFQVYES